MCGIVGAVAQRDVAPILLEGLRRLEYRGYDSAGLTVVDKDKQLHRCRRVGKVNELSDAVDAQPLDGTIGIAHTRWATHGKPTESNAHPHTSFDEVALVHNGIIENYETHRDRLRDAGYDFSSDTDTETIIHLIHSFLADSKDLLSAVQTAVTHLQGAYSLCVVSQRDPDHLIAVRSGSPLVIGVGIGEHFVASDALALQPVTQDVIYLEEGDVAEIRADHVTVYDKQGSVVERPICKSTISQEFSGKGNFRHFMLKEIFEQPSAIANTLEGRLTQQAVLTEVLGPNAVEIFSKVKRVQIVACGTSYHAGLVARYWIESIAGLPCHVEIASEVRYRNNVVEDNTLLLLISQSGETADTLAALRKAKTQNYLSSLAICNVPHSSLVRETALNFMTRAGAEIGVASTKAFTTQLVSLLMITLMLAKQRGLTAEDEHHYVTALHELPSQVEQLLNLDEQIQALAPQFSDKHHALFIGRGEHFPIAQEGALKLKEISYIHAEAYPAGELKHGALALVDKDMPVIAIAPNDALFEKLKSNLQEVKARGGQLISFADASVQLNDDFGTTIQLPTDSAGHVSPILHTIALQLLAYHVAVIKGTDVDQPRNLAKSVTVE